MVGTQPHLCTCYFMCCTMESHRFSQKKGFLTHANQQDHATKPAVYDGDAILATINKSDVSAHLQEATPIPNDGC